MKTSNNSTIKSLLEDPYFHKWIINPDKACRDFWANWAAKSEDRQACMELARDMLLSFEFRSDSVSPQEKTNLWDQISEQIQQPKPVEA